MNVSHLFCINTSSFYYIININFVFCQKYALIRISYAAFPPKLAGLHFFLEAGIPTNNWLLFSMGKAITSDLYLNCNVVCHIMTQ